MLLRAHNVKTSSETFIREIGDHSVTLFDIWTNKERVVPDVEVVVLGTLRRPRNELVEALRERVARVDVLGDANSPGRMPKATRDGFFFGWDL
jgi:hypothetical protein